DAARRLGYPVLVKPFRVVTVAGGVTRRASSVRADDDAALLAAASTVGEPYLVQACEAGPVVSFGGVLADGQLVGVAASRYLRTWQPTAGNVAFSETIV